MITLGWRWALFALGTSGALIDELTSVSEGTRAPKRTPPRLGCVTGDLHELPLGRQRYSVNRLATVVPTVCKFYLLPFLQKVVPVTPVPYVGSASPSRQALLTRKQVADLIGVSVSCL